MESKKLLVSLVAMFALLLLVTNVSAFADIRSVEVNGVEVDQQSFAVFAGQTIPVRVIFTAGNSDAEDVRIKARIKIKNNGKYFIFF